MVDLKLVRSELAKMGYSPEIIKSGMEKACRWMVHAYGEENWDEFENEHGTAAEGVVSYCEESKKDPSGRVTANRINAIKKNKI